MFQNWRDLLFLHFSLPASEIKPLLPPSLEVDTFPNNEGVASAWVGLVPFRMERIHPRWMPAVPWLSAFPETNVRTYVHRRGEKPGVWFFSLDAARWLACKYALVRFRLPYFHAAMRTKRTDARANYRSERRGSAASADIQVEIGAPLGAAQPNSLEFFLIERYLLYFARGSRLFTGQVHHDPYQLRNASVVSCQQSLVKAVGIESRPWEHSCLVDAVNVEIFPLQEVRSIRD